MSNPFWTSKATISRQVLTTTDDGFSKNDVEVVYENVACHLSNNGLANRYKNNQVDNVNCAYTLFCDTKYKIMNNDVIEVKTLQGQSYKVYAGESRIYPMSCQTACNKEPVTVEVA